MDRQLSTVQSDDLPGKAQTDTGSLFLGGKERNEDVVQQVGRDTRTVIGQLDPEAPTLVGDFELYFFVFLVRQGLHGVLQQVDEHLRQHFFIGIDCYFRLVKVDRQVDVLALQVLLVQQQEVFDESGQRKQLPFGSSQTRKLPVGFRKVYQVLSLALDGFQSTDHFPMCGVGDGLVRLGFPVFLEIP